MENELFPNSSDASPLSSMRLPSTRLELPMKEPVRLSSIVSSPAAFFTTRPTPRLRKPSEFESACEAVRGLNSAAASSGTVLKRGFARSAPSLAGELLCLGPGAAVVADRMRALARETSKLSSIVTSAAVLAAAARKLAS